MRKQEEFPSYICIKQLKTCWIERINVLKGLLVQLDDVSQMKHKHIQILLAWILLALPLNS